MRMTCMCGDPLEIAMQKEDKTGKVTDMRFYPCEECIKAAVEEYAAKHARTDLTDGADFNREESEHDAG